MASYTVICTNTVKKSVCVGKTVRVATATFLVFNKTEPDTETWTLCSLESFPDVTILTVKCLFFIIMLSRVQM